MTKLKQTVTSRIFICVTVLFLAIGGVMPNDLSMVHAETMVYVTPTGSKYHSHQCGRGTYTLTTLSNAQARGLSPCSKCFSGGYVPDPDPAPTPTPSPAPAPAPVVKPIKINKTSVLLLKGQKTNLKIKNATETVSWHSSKSSVVSVSQTGKITARKKGKATITARIGSTEKRCRVTVESPKLNARKISLNIGQTRKLKLSGCKHSVKWTTGNSYVANVRKGLITAKNPGSAKITAKVHGKKFVCNVTVKKPVVQKVLLDTSSVQMDFYDQKVIKVATAPALAMEYYPISVTSSNPSIVSADFDDYDNTILLHSSCISGTATISVSVNGKTAVCQVTVQTKEIPPSGEEDI